MSDVQVAYWIGPVGTIKRFDTVGPALDIQVADPTIVAIRSGTRDEHYGIFLTALADGNTTATFQDHRGVVSVGAGIYVADGMPPGSDILHVTRDAGIW